MSYGCPTSKKVLRKRFAINQPIRSLNQLSDQKPPKTTVHAARDPVHPESAIETQWMLATSWGLQLCLCLEFPSITIVSHDSHGQPFLPERPG